MEREERVTDDLRGKIVLWTAGLAIIAPSVLPMIFPHLMNVWLMPVFCVIGGGIAWMIAAGGGSSQRILEMEEKECAAILSGRKALEARGINPNNPISPR